MIISAAGLMVGIIIVLALWHDDAVTQKEIAHRHELIEEIRARYERERP